MSRSFLPFLLGVAVAVTSLTRATEPAAARQFRGQVVCSRCWFEADRTRVPYGTAGDLDCARRCHNDGVSAALAIRNDQDGAFVLLTLAGPPPAQPSWLERIGRFVEVTGRVDDTTLHVDSVTWLDASPWPPPSTEPAADPATLSWTDLSGHRLGLADLHGRVVVLNFWATWCAPCRKEMPDLVRIQNRYAVLGVQVLGAAADPPDHTAGVLEFARSKKLNFPVVLGADTSHMQAVGVGPALPATVVLDREGHVVERFAGVFERAALEASIQRALAGDGHDDHEGHAHGEHDHEHGEAGPVHTAVVGGIATQASLVPS